MLSTKMLWWWRGDRWAWGVRVWRQEGEKGAEVGVMLFKDYAI